MANSVAKRILELRKVMKKEGANWYFCTSDDFHASEYVADYFKVREYYTGFTGENALYTSSFIYSVWNPLNCTPYLCGQYVLSISASSATGISL